MDETAAIDAACDNDVLLKATCYGLTAALWPSLGSELQVGVLGAARYVVSNAVDRKELTRDKGAARAELTAFFDAANVLEPTESELAFAAEMETAALREGLALDAGESQLVAMTIERSIRILQTGDKRAVHALELLLEQLEALMSLAGKVQCLEQLMLALVSRKHDFGVVAAAICAEPSVDKTMSICFGCYSGSPTAQETVVEGLSSYVADARADAPRILAA